MPAPLIELITEASCPHVAAARAVILAACRQLGIPAQWREWDVQDVDLPSYAAGYGSPTILIAGVDVEQAQPDNSACCRLYQESTQGVPAIQVVVDALRTASTHC